MRNKKKILPVMIGVLLAIGMLCVWLVGRIINSNPDYPIVTRKEAAKLLTAVVGVDEAKDYYETAISEGMLGVGIGEDYYSNDDLLKTMECFGVDRQYVEEKGVKLKRKQKAVRREDFFVVYDMILDKTQCESVSLSEMTIVATPGSNEKVATLEVYTDLGSYEFEGVLDGYIDNRIRAYVCGREILGVRDVVSTSVTYRNVWVHSGDEFVVSAYVSGIDRTFYVEGLSQKVSGVMADLQVTDGTLTSIKIRTDAIKGRVLSVTESYVEIEGYGKVPFDPDYKLYKNFNGFGEINYGNILVGYELQDFIVADGMIAGAIVMYPFEVQDIRIILRNSGFESIYHNTVEVTCDGDYKVVSGNDLTKEEIIIGGKTLVLDKKSNLLKGGRIRIIPVNPNDRIEISSIERSQGKPAYPGFLEIGMDDKGLYIVNEVNLEQYLKLVVPSEMPAGYGEEASKVQAVCARSYAYNQLLNNDYMEYGAHIDDSTWYQVYNNTIEYASSNAAVDATCGQVMTQNGQVITAYYYSTSCGHGSDISIWGQDGKSCPYITAHTINPDSQYLDLTSNEVFYNYITAKNQDDFDSTFPLYRWNAKLTMEQINALYKEKANVGKITSIDVIERKAGGSVDKVVVTGDKGTYIVEGELNARKFFGSQEIDMINNRGKVFNMSSLPSGFFALKPTHEKGMMTGYEIVGGGFGHGLGMSQNGAYAMTKAGYTYDQILKFFYSGIEITQIY